MKTNLTKKAVMEYKKVVRDINGKMYQVSFDGEFFSVVVDGVAMCDTTQWKTVTEFVGGSTRNWFTSVDEVETVVEAISSSVEVLAAPVKETTTLEVPVVTITRPQDVAVQDQEVVTDICNPAEHKLAEFLAEGAFVTYAFIAIDVNEGCYVDLRDANSDEVYWEKKSDAFRILSEAGVPAAQIAKMFGAHYSFVYGVLKRNNSMVPTSKQAVAKGEACTFEIDGQQVTTNSKKEMMIEMFKADFTAREISEMLCTHVSYVRTVLAKYKKEVAAQ